MPDDLNEHYDAGGKLISRVTVPWTVETTNRAAIFTKAQQALAANATFLAIATPSAAQNAAQVKLLTREVNGLIRLLLGALSDVSDT